MLKNKGLIGSLIILTVSMFLFGAIAFGAEYTIKIGNIYPQEHPIGMGIEKFAEVLEKETNGMVEVETYHNSVLGSEREMAEEVKIGTLEMLVSGLGGIGNFVPEMAVLELPYMYNDMLHLKRVTNELKPDITEIFVKKGFRPLAYFYLGPRNIASVKPLSSFKDIQGLKLRVPEAPMYIGMAKALGTDPTPVAYNEVYTALQTGVAEAMEGSPDSVYLNHFFEPAPYYNLSKHIYQVMYMIVNESFYSQLPQNVKEAIEKAGSESTQYELEQVISFNEKYMKMMEDEGSTIIEIKDLTPFREAVSSFTEDFARDLGDSALKLYKKAQEVN